MLEENTREEVQFAPLLGYAGGHNILSIDSRISSILVNSLVLLNGLKNCTIPVLVIGFSFLHIKVAVRKGINCPFSNRMRRSSGRAHGLLGVVKCTGFVAVRVVLCQ